MGDEGLGVATVRAECLSLNGRLGRPGSGHRGCRWQEVAGSSAGQKLEAGGAGPCLYQEVRAHCLEDRIRQDRLNPGGLGNFL